MRFSAGVVLLLFLVGSLWGIGIEKIHEVEYESEVNIYSMGQGSIIVAQHGSQGYGLELFQEGKKVQSVRLPTGEGPGEVNMIKGIIPGKNCIYVWDDQLKRLSKFDKKWKFRELYKFPKLRIALLLGRLGDSFAFRWGELGIKGGERTITTFVGLVSETGEKKSFYQITSRLTRNKKLNQRRVYLMAAFFGNRLVVGHSQQYKLQEKQYVKGQILDGITLARETKPVPFEKKFLEKRKKLLALSVEEYTPTFIPPLFDVQMDGDYTAVVLQEALARDRTKIDIWRTNKYLGSVEIPLIFAQEFVFPPPFNISIGFLINNGKLYSLHYDMEEDIFRVCTWQIKF